VNRTLDTADWDDEDDEPDKTVSDGGTVPEEGTEGGMLNSLMGALSLRRGQRAVF